jgi:hypothetical protein
MTPQTEPAAPRALSRREARGLSRMRVRAELSRHGVERPAPSRAHVSLWVPTTVIFALLAPFALALSPFLLLAPPRYRLGPHTVLAFGAVLFALSGTHVDVDTPDARVRIQLF